MKKKTRNKKKFKKEKNLNLEKSEFINSVTLTKVLMKKFL